VTEKHTQRKRGITRHDDSREGKTERVYEAPKGRNLVKGTRNCDVGQGLIVLLWVKKISSESYNGMRNKCYQKGVNESNWDGEKNRGSGPGRKTGRYKSGNDNRFWKGTVAEGVKSFVPGG